MRYHCPFCDYKSDSRGSVEGHISGKSDSSHKGKVGRSHRSDIIQDAQTTTLSEKVASITGDSPASTNSTQEQIHQLRADVKKLDEKLSRRISNIEDTINARPSKGELRNQAVEDVTGELKAELKNIEEQKQEVLSEFRETTDNLNKRLIRESKRAAKDEVSDQNEAVNESLRKMAIMMSTLPTNTKVQCPSCGEYVKFKKGHKVTSSKGTNLTCPSCRIELINELPPSVDKKKSEYV
jgi:predicted Zn-ribbon and HTH transcriptional regulator